MKEFFLFFRELLQMVAMLPKTPIVPMMGRRTLTKGVCYYYMNIVIFNVSMPLVVNYLYIKKSYHSSSANAFEKIH